MIRVQTSELSKRTGWKTCFFHLDAIWASRLFAANVIGLDEASLNVWHDSHATWHHVYERKCDLNQWKSFGLIWRSCNMSTCIWKDLRSEPLTLCCGLKWRSWNMTTCNWKDLRSEPLTLCCGLKWRSWNMTTCISKTLRSEPVDLWCTWISVKVMKHDNVYIMEELERRMASAIHYQSVKQSKEPCAYVIFIAKASSTQSISCIRSLHSCRNLESTHLFLCKNHDMGIKCA